ncbi:MAG: restriction endonuclease subunit S [Chitinophagales bacterium]
METATKKQTFQKYEVYKDSGVEWLGEIPEGWDIIRIKNLFREKIIRSEDGKGELLSMSKFYGVIPRKELTNKVEPANSLIGYKICHKGDLIMNKLQAWNGMLDISKYAGLVSPDYSVFQAINAISSKYFMYLFKTSSYIAEFTRNSSGVGEGFFRLYTNKFYAISSIFPPISEQTAIAHFLDTKTSKIDTAIAQKEKMIALLQERQQIIIQNAVTKGLDPTAKMKDSGVEWIGEIPEGWEVTKLKQICKVFGRIGFRGYTTSDLVAKGEGAITISPSNIQGDDYNFDEK